MCTEDADARSGTAAMIGKGPEEKRRRFSDASTLPPFAEIAPLESARDRI